MKKTRGIPIGIMLKSKIVRETLKAKGYDLNQVETGDAQIDEDFMRLLEKLADDKLVFKVKGKGLPECYTSQRDKETTQEMERTVHDNGSAPARTVLPIEYGACSAL